MTTAATHTGRPKREAGGTPRAVHREFGLSDADALDLYYAMVISRRLRPRSPACAPCAPRIRCIYSIAACQPHTRGG